VWLRWLSALVAAAIVIGGSASVASASQSAKVVSEWKAADGPFATADGKWTSALSGSNPSLSQVKKASLAFIPAVKTFDSALQKIHFTGKTASDISSLIKTNKKEITILGHVTSLKSFISQFGALDPTFQALQGALSKDLGIQEAEIII
jgi:hypothetical protein